MLIPWRGTRDKSRVNRRPLGRTGLEVSEIGFGCWQLCNDDSWGGMDVRTAHRLVHAAVDGGINLFDTAPNYAGTQSERVLGDALRGKREKVLLVSKFGHMADGRTEFTVNGFRESLEGSLGRLRTDYLDVLLLHNPPRELFAGTDPLWDAMEEARLQGKIRHYGASLDFAAEVQECLSNTKSSVLEVLFNIFHQDVRHAFADVRQKGAGIIVKVPLDSGWLTGRFDAGSRFEGIRARWSEGQIAQRAELVSRLRWLVEDGSELAHKAIGYLLAYNEVSCVIPGMRTLQQLASNLAAASCRVTLADRRRLEEFWDDVTENGAKLLPW